MKIYGVMKDYLHKISLKVCHTCLQGKPLQGMSLNLERIKFKTTYILSKPNLCHNCMIKFYECKMYYFAQANHIETENWSIVGTVIIQSRYSSIKESELTSMSYELCVSTSVRSRYSNRTVIFKE